MNSFTSPNNHVFWYRHDKKPLQCTQNMHTEIAIIGGGMAGLSAAQAFADRGKKVAVFEQYFCGAGASGKSSGFITPNEELSLSDFSYQNNNEQAQKIWNFINGGIANIRNNIQTYNFDCG